MEKDAEAGAQQAAAPAPASYSSEDQGAAEDSGTLASDEALAALREKLTGNK